MFILFIAVFIIQAISTSLVSTIFLVVLLVFAVVEAVVGLFLFVISVSWTSRGRLKFSKALPF
jgi:hypothetical protein